MEKNNMKAGLTITVPEGAVFGLYADVPSSTNYFKSIDPKNAIEPSETYTSSGISFYCYYGLSAGIYHYGASMEGYTAVCQIINYTPEKANSHLRIEVELCALAGNGYESGYVMMNSSEFIDANLASEKDSWGEEYAYLFNTPQFTRRNATAGRHQQTTNKEIYEFIDELKAKNKNMYLFSLGKTPKYEFDMPLVLFTRENLDGKSLEEAARIIRNNGKPTVQYAAQVHSNEPASTEGALAMMIALCGKFGDKILGSTDVYIIPRINLDGAVEVIREAPTTHEDMNRDYLYANNKEIRMVISAYNLFLPEVVVDGHEKRSAICRKDTFICTDMDVQVGAGSLNHPAIMTETGMKIALEAIRKAHSLGLRAHFYTAFASAAGGSAGSSYFGTRNSVSFLVETPGGTTLGNLCMARRAFAQYILASTAMEYTTKHASEIMRTVHESREKMSAMGNTYDEANLIVLEHEKATTGSVACDVVDVPSGKITEKKDVEYAEHVIALRSRVRPTAYVIPRGIENEKRILDLLTCHDVPYYTLPNSSVVRLRQYVKSEEIAELTEEFDVRFEKGAYVFPNTVPSTVLSVIMEPDFNAVSKRRMSLLSMKLIDHDENGRLPIYRFCHNLSDGKIDQQYISI